MRILSKDFIVLEKDFSYLQPVRTVELVLSVFVIGGIETIGGVKMFHFDSLGQEIVEELSSLIQGQILLTDRRGFIQASTDPTRVNQFHEGALLSLREKRMLYMTDQEVESLHGVRQGVVFPIIIEGESIAVLGITGEPDRIRPQALLILRVVELFIQDSLKRKEEEEKIRDLEFFIFDWITSAKKDKRFLERAVLLGIEVECYQQVVIIEAIDPEKQFTIHDVNYLVSVQNVHPLVKLIRWGRGKMLMILPEIDQVVLKNELEHLLLHAKRKTKIEAVAGIGQPAGYIELSKSFNQAERAVDVSKKFKRVVFEHELRFDLILQSIPDHTREEFLKRTVAPLTKYSELLHNLRVWFSENQSMQNTAQKLHIHKNTLSYRLQKVEQLTGLSVNHIEDVLLLYIGLRLLEESKNESL
jgi:carbohydrate diacid regulator